MPVFKEYDELGNLSYEKVEPLSEKNLGLFFQNYSQENAEIYLQALREFTQQMREMIIVDHGDNRSSQNTSNRGFTKLKKLYAHNKLILERIEKFNNSETPKPTQS